MTGATIIRRARKRANLTQAELAKRLGTSQPVVARWESGRVSPTIATLARLIKACELSLSISLVERNDHDLELALENLKYSPEERFERFAKGIEFARELRHAAGRTS